MTDIADPKATIAALEAELEAMRTAASVREQVIADGYAQMDQMLVEMEKKADALEVASRESAAARAVLDRILDTMHGALLVVDNDGKISQVNARLCERTGLSREQLVGQKPEQLFVLSELQELAQTHRVDWPEAFPVARVFGHPRVQDLDGSLVASDGSSTPHVFRSGVLRGPQGKKEGVVIVGNDVSDLKATLAQVREAHAGMKLVLDNIDQGLMTIDREGRVAPSYSARIEEWFGSVGEEERVWDLLDRFDPDAGLMFEMSFEQIIDGFLPLEVSLHQITRTLTRDGRSLRIEVHVVGDEEDFENLLVVVTDVTAAIAAAAAEAERREFLNIVERIVTDRDFFLQFFNEACALVDQLDASTDAALHRRLVHTLKGNASIFGIMSVADVCHGIEDRLMEERTALTEDELRAIHTAWDAMVQKVGRFVADAGDTISITPDTHQRLLEALERRPELQTLAREVARWRHPTVEAQLRRLGLQAERLAGQLGKPLHVDLRFDDSRLPEEGWSRLWSSLVHLIRNALDHGIEEPEARARLGKPEIGTLTLAARCEDDVFVLEAEDDGMGIDWARIRDKAERLGAPVASDEDLVEALFIDGLSTREQASTLSGRGVGMAAIREAVEALGGEILVVSKAGQGTCFRFEFRDEAIPASLAA